MLIRPIDMQVMLQNTPEASRQHQQEVGRPEMVHQTFSQQLNKETEQRNQQVTETPESEQQTVNKDGRGGSKYKKNRNGKDNKENSEEEKGSGKAKTNSLFDVTI